MKVFDTAHAQCKYEIDNPVYRVNFWHHSYECWALEAYLLTDVEDVTEVLTWAQDHAKGMRYEVLVETEDSASNPVSNDISTGRIANLIRLFGDDPNSDPAPSAYWEMIPRD